VKLVVKKLLLHFVVKAYYMLYTLKSKYIRILKQDLQTMQRLTTKVEYATDIRLGRIVRLKSYRVQRKKGAKSFVIAGANTVFSFIAFLHVFAILCN
jgi:hypothetical protein